MKQIASIKIVHEIDESPDTSYLGEYTSEYGKWIIERKHYGYPPERNQYERFKLYPSPSEGKTREERKELFRWAIKNYERMESLNNGNWHYIGIRVIAEININGVLQDISSGGLWGIESDSSNDYIKEVEEEEISNLISQLKELGFTDEEINEIEIEESE